MTASRARLASLGPRSSRLLAAAYRGSDFPARLRILGWIRSACGNRRIEVGGRFGERFAVDPADGVQAALLYHGAYEPEVVDALRAHLAEGDVLLDVGSHVGACSLPLAVGFGVDVVAFEADPEVASVLQLNARINGLSEARFRIERTAVGDRDGRAVLHRAPDDNIGRSALSPLPDAVGQVEVPIVRLDGYLARHRLARVRAWKLDVEGAEGLVLAGASRTLSERPPAVIVFEDAARAPTESAVAATLVRHGYVIDRIARPGGDTQARENFIAVRGDRAR